MTTSHQDRDFRAASGLAAWQADITQLTDPDQVLPRGPGLFEISRANGGRLVTNIRRLAGAERPPGSVLIATAAWLLTLIGGGALYVSFAAQRQYVFDARRQDMASIIEALLLDALMIVFTLLALGLSRAGKSSRAERALILGCAAASAYMNASAADTASPRSVVAYTVAPVALAVVVDRVVAVIRRHVLADNEASAWTILGHSLMAAARLAVLVALYVLRLALDPSPTAKGLRRAVLNAAPLPAGQPEVKVFAAAAEHYGRVQEGPAARPVPAAPWLRGPGPGVPAGRRTRPEGRPATRIGPHLPVQGGRRRDGGRTVTAISLREWEQQMDAGETTYTVGSREPVEAYLDRAEAEAAANRPGTTLVQWNGHHGHQLASGQREVQADAELEPEAGQ